MLIFPLNPSCPELQSRKRSFDHASLEGEGWRFFFIRSVSLNPCDLLNLNHLQTCKASSFSEEGIENRYFSTQGVPQKMLFSKYTLNILSPRGRLQEINSQNAIQVYRFQLACQLL